MPDIQLTKDQLSIVQAKLEDFIEGDRSDRAKITKSALAEMKTLNSNQTTEEKKNLAKVGITHLVINSHTECIAQRVRQWFHNHGRKRTKKAHRNYVQRWNMRMVVAHEKKQEVVAKATELSGFEGGSTKWMSKYQAALTSICEALSQEDQDNFTKMAEEWNAKSPPASSQNQ
jgi:hypothetical protein